MTETVRVRWGAGVVYRCELVKLTAQWWVKAILGACFVAPFAFALAIEMQDTEPTDTLFGRWVHDSGFASPLVVLGFATQWGFPLLACLVAGDIFSSEDRYGTWKTILTRSRGRTEILIGKSLAAASYSVAVVVLSAAGSLLSGVLLLGHQPLVNLSGTPLPAGRAAGLVALSWATALPPVLGFTALGLFFSLTTRNSVAGVLGSTVIGLLMEIYAFVNGPDVIRHLLLTTPFDSWHGFLVDKPFYGPLEEGLAVSAAYVVVLMAAAYVVIRRRDFTEG
ncbi:MAG TPA: ABC transporter permease [Amycolatopsis sp.]|uniref:ABC transporter permease n=1 Tax=Amycolatopsis sp. TaxID=37632 RepID=UPI002B476A09|nr:ABC transporter permease [Amycolatopsis sp.]HKS50053.1 ABC transporter permease [Amycolatopsis sp.]